MRTTTGICVALALLCAPAVGAPAVGAAGELRGVRVESLRGDLRSLRGRAPDERVYELKQLRRRLAEQRVDTPDDPRLERLELQRRHRQWQAERALRQGRARLAGGRDGLGEPAYLRAPTDLDIRGTALPIGTGKLFLFIQSGLREARAALGRGRSGAAAEHLANAEAGLRALRAAADAADPNVVALAAEIAALRAQVDAGPG